LSGAAVAAGRRASGSPATTGAKRERDTGRTCSATGSPSRLVESTAGKASGNRVASERGLHDERRRGAIAPRRRASNTLSRNLLTSLDLGTSSQIAHSEYNLIKNGSRPGATDRAFTPRFADRLHYRPANLPAGYENVGYRYTPAGHTAVP
jgi:hypothetical protein